jgi:DNA-binding transcriptional LysR family regulator
VLADDDAADLAGRYPTLIARLNLDDTAITELVGGEQDVFVAACADPLAGLHGPPGKPCPARPWVCPLCPLAIFAPRHATNLLRLKAFFARQWRQMPSEHFMAVFGPYSTRIGQVLDRYPTQLLAAAASSLAETADDEDAVPLRPEERTI